MHRYGMVLLSFHWSFSNINTTDYEGRKAGQRLPEKVGGSLPISMSEQNLQQPRAKRRLREKKLKTPVIVVLILLFWGGLVYGGYYIALKHMQETEQYFANQMIELKLENQRIEEEIISVMQLVQTDLESFNQEIVQIRSEMNMIQDELELTGESITGTDQTRLSLQARIIELDQQLAGLREQLRKLEAAVRAL